MNFQTAYNWKKDPPESNLDDSLVETAGYIPSKKRIENLMLAGLMLKEFRMEQFDFHENQVDETYFDRTRSKNFDLADISEMRRDLEARSKARIKERREAEKKASETIIEAPQEPKKDEKG